MCMIIWFIFAALVAGMAILTCGSRHLFSRWQQNCDRALAAAEIIAATEWEARYRAARQIPKYFATPAKGIRYSGSIDVNSAK